MGPLPVRQRPQLTPLVEQQQLLVRLATLQPGLVLTVGQQLLLALVVQQLQLELLMAQQLPLLGRVEPAGPLSPLYSSLGPLAQPELLVSPPLAVAHPVPPAAAASSGCHEPNTDRHSSPESLPSHE